MLTTLRCDPDLSRDRANGIVTTIVDSEIVVAERSLFEIANDLTALYPAEKAAIVSAVAKRQHEFIAGRVLAREALYQLRESPRPVLCGNNRSPIWPDGVVGSISHTTHWCAAALAHSEKIRSIGIDVEEESPLENALFPMVLGSDELMAIEGLSIRKRGMAGKIIFSAKEAFYKAQYPLTKKFLDFHAVHVYLDWECCRWLAVLSKSPGGGLVVGDVFEGHWISKNGLIATSLVLR